MDTGFYIRMAAYFVDKDSKDTMRSREVTMG